MDWECQLIGPRHSGSNYCTCYRAMKLVENGMKVVERVL